MRKAGAEAAEAKGGAQDDGVADLGRGHDRLVHGDGGEAHRDLLADLAQLVREDFAILGGEDGVDGGAEDLDVVLREEARVRQLDAAVEGRLATKL